MNTISLRIFPNDGGINRFERKINQRFRESATLVLELLIFGNKKELLRKALFLFIP